MIVIAITVRSPIYGKQRLQKLPISIPILAQIQHFAIPAAERSSPTAAAQIHGIAIQLLQTTLHVIQRGLEYTRIPSTSLIRACRGDEAA
jgi:hypothetical protein